jgi:hypothetical protein
VNPYTACGFWPDRGQLAVSIADTGGRLHRAALAPADELECWTCLAEIEDLYGLDVQLVIPEPLLRAGPIAAVARARGMTVLAAPSLLAEAIAAVAYARHGPQRLATVLARLPGSRFQGHLRPLPRRDPRQMLLL